MYNKYTHKKFYHRTDIDETEYSKIAHIRKEKIQKYELLKSEKCSDKAIFEVLDISRATFFRWKKRYKLYGLSGLEDESKIPIKKRKSTWSKEVENNIYHLRIKYPLWGKAKIAIAYKRQYKEKISVSMTGRIIKKLINHNKIYPVQFLLYKKIKKNRVFDSHAKRWQRGMKSTRPGELMQFDHMTINVPGFGQLKQFSAVCPLTKIAVEKVYEDANSRNGADFLRHVISQLPFPIISIQVDGGGEFMKDFENLCAKLNIPLWVLPPKSPEYNCNVERGNGTFKYEFYAQCERFNNFHILQKRLQQFVSFYNKERPHHGINLLTPYEFYESIKMRS
jgi:transposase InsO family protein